MFFGKKKTDAIFSGLSQREEGADYSALFFQKFKKNRLAVWALRCLYFLIFIALFADFIANEKPIFCQIEGKSYFPILRQYAVDLGFSQWDNDLLSEDWLEREYDFVIRTPIPYSAQYIDLKNGNWKGPFDTQVVASNHYRHWLGTDKIGRDVAAGLITGIRIALLVGLFSMSIASLIGVFMGTLAGYFGDDGIKISLARLFANIVALFIALFYGFIAKYYHLIAASQEGTLGMALLKSIALCLFILLIFNLLSPFFKKIPYCSQKVAIPFDLTIMRLIEVMNSIPALLLLLALVAIFQHNTLWQVVLIIGLIAWTQIARFLRAELLRIRQLPYIEAARAMGYPEWHIALQHALPNALTPILIAVAFGIAGSILLEASLSFLGIGIPLDAVTWGRQLAEARGAFSAWWLAVFPGLAIFVTVTVFNLIGEGITEAAK